MNKPNRNQFFAQDISPSLILKDLRVKSESYWAKVKEETMLSLFHAAAKRVPAYKDFLKKQKINPEKIQAFKDFSYVPPISKFNYIRAYPYKELFWDGNISKPQTIHSTSGSTGETTYFQREFKFDLRREVVFENFLRANKLTITGPTLFIITFGMGVWSAGLGIYTGAYLAVNFNNFPVSIVSPGVNKTEVLKILKSLAPNFKQVIFAGYPPFIKDVLDQAADEGIKIKKMKLRFIFTGEAFTEEFRDYLSDRVGTENIFLDTMNTYGTSELGATAVETPLTIFARRLAYNNRNIFKGLFGNIVKTPTIAQNIPYFVNFDCVDEELFFTGDSSIPLVRYKSGDNGGIMSYGKLKEILADSGVNLDKQTKKLGIFQHIHKVPLVYVYERKNLTATLYSILIYPEFIKTALYDKDLIKFLTGKFTMLTRYNENQDQYLEINLELKRNTRIKNYHQKIALKRIVETLIAKSSEFKELSTNLGPKAYPKLIFWPYEYPEYFAGSLKQKWVATEIPLT